MFLLRLLLVLQSCLSIDYWKYPEPHRVCTETYDVPLKIGPLTKFKFNPEPHYKNGTAFLWKSYGGARPEVDITVCEYTAIYSILFDTSNVESTTVMVYGQTFDYNVKSDGANGCIDVMLLSRKCMFGHADPHSNVKSMRLEMTYSGSYFKVGWEIKIALTPKNNQAPVVMTNLDIRICYIPQVTCPEKCAMYQLDASSGCKEQLCTMYKEPCYGLDCGYDQECRLIEDKDYDTYPGFMLAEAQLWGCVDKSSTDYGCVCKKYGISKYGCPTCDCQS